MKYNKRAQEAHEVSISDLLTAAGFDTLPKHPPIDAVETVLSKLVSLLSGADDLRIQCAREEEIRRLNALGLSSPAKLVDAALTFKPTSHDDTPNTVTLSDPDPWPQPVDGAALLDELLHWLQSYLFLPRGAAEANALWAIATWCVDIVHFAPILAVLSATKRCGKSYLLDLLRYIVRRGHWTSALGATPATIFRLNDSDKPTFLIDEAEKLGGRNPSTELIHLLNQGYRRGGKVTRCIEH